MRIKSQLYRNDKNVETFVRIYPHSADNYAQFCISQGIFAIMYTLTSCRVLLSQNTFRFW